MCVSARLTTFGALLLVLLLANSGAGGLRLKKRTAVRSASVAEATAAKAVSQEERTQTVPQDGGDFDVDVVITWVQTPGKQEIAEIRRACKTYTAEDMRKFRDLSTFQKALLSIDRFLPWVRRVFVVTNGQVPCGMNSTRLPIELVTHDQIWPEERKALGDLPTYSSRAIETHVHRIRGLAERFIYFNDDFFVGRPLDRSFFFAGENGAPVIWDKVPGQSSRREHRHQAMGFLKSAIVSAEEASPDVFASFSGTKCRVRNGSPPFWRYSDYQRSKGIARPGKWTPRKDGGPRTAWLTDVNVNDDASWYRHVLAERPAVFCINDDFSVDPTTFAAQARRLHVFLDDYFGPERLTSQACPGKEAPE